MKTTTAIAGATFRAEGTEIVTSLKPGQRYRLEREPSNPHDRNAVQIWVDDYEYGRRKPQSYHIGYVPRKWSAAVSAALASNNLHVWAVKPDALWGSIAIHWEDVSKDPLG